MDTDPPDPGGGYGCVTPPNGLSSVPSMDSENIPNKRPRTISPSPNVNVIPTHNDQYTYAKPEFLDKRKYSLNDSSPFIVHVSKSDSSSPIRPMEFGRYLFQKNITSVALGGVKRIGRNRVSVEFKNVEDANNFLESSILTDAGFSASIPSYNVLRMGIVRGVAIDISMEEFALNCTVPSGYGDVVKARRMCRKSTDVNGSVTWVPTQTVVVTFNGQKLPPHTYLYYTSLPVELYKLPVIQCNRCCRFGHVKAICRSDPRCYKCAQPHEGVSCNTQVVSCLFCSGAHTANNINCPEYIRQKEIKVAMSEQNISYTEASARFPRARRAFTDVVATPSAVSSQVRHSTPSPSPTVSYRKTVYIPRRTVPTPQPGYDHHAHQAIIQNPVIESPNGSAFPNNSLSQNDDFPELLSSLLLNLLSRFSDTGMGMSNTLRENLTKLINITKLNNTLNDSEDHNTMELS